MVFGRPTTASAILLAISGQAATAGAWITDPAYSFISLDLKDTPESGGPADVFLVTGLRSGTAWQPDVAGGGNDVETITSTIEVTLFNRVDVDDAYRDTVTLTDASLGILAKWRDLVKSLNMFCPVHSPSGECILEEPMRMLDFEVLPRPARNGWARMATRFEVKWRMDLS